VGEPTQTTANTIKVARVTYETASGPGGTATTGVWTPRPLNTVHDSMHIGLQLSGNQFTLPAGTYAIQAYQSFHKAQHTQIRLYNVSTAQTVEYSDVGYTETNISVTAGVHLYCEFTIQRASVYQLQYLVRYNSGAWVLGSDPQTYIPMDANYRTVHAVVQITQLNCPQANPVLVVPSTLCHNNTTLVAYVKDIKAQGSNGGASTASAWFDRDLNTVEDPLGVGISVSGNHVTIPPGAYTLESKMPFLFDETTYYVSRLYDLTTNQLLVTGDHGYWSRTSNEYSTQWSTCQCVINLTQPTTIAVQYYVSNDSDNIFDLGESSASGSSNYEVYTVLKITKLGNAVIQVQNTPVAESSNNTLQTPVRRYAHYKNKNDGTLDYTDIPWVAHAVSSYNEITLTGDTEFSTTKLRTYKVNIQLNYHSASTERGARIKLWEDGVIIHDIPHTHGTTANGYCSTTSTYIITMIPGRMYKVTFECFDGGNGNLYYNTSNILFEQMSEELTQPLITQNTQTLQLRQEWLGWIYNGMTYTTVGANDDTTLGNGGMLAWNIDSNVTGIAGVGIAEIATLMYDFTPTDWNLHSNGFGTWTASAGRSMGFKIETSSDNGSTWTIHCSMTFDDSNNSAAHLGGTKWRGTWAEGTTPTFLGRFADSGVSPDPIPAGNIMRCYFYNLTGTSLMNDSECAYALGGIYSQPNPQHITPIPLEVEVVHPIWLGYKTASQSVPNGWAILNTYVATQTRGSWATANADATYNYWTVPRAGFYHISADVSIDVTVTFLIGIAVNYDTNPGPTTHLHGYKRVDGVSYIATATDVYCNAGDKLYVHINQNGGTRTVPLDSDGRARCDLCIRHTQD